jgi:hypothetical protein
MRSGRPTHLSLSPGPRSKSAKLVSIKIPYQYSQPRPIISMKIHHFQASHNLSKNDRHSPQKSVVLVSNSIIVITLSYPKKERGKKRGGKRTVEKTDRTRGSIFIPRYPLPASGPPPFPLPFRGWIRRHLFRPETNSLGLMNPTL